MIFFDVTKSGAARPRSGLMRVNQRLRQELGDAVHETIWPQVQKQVGRSDWFITSELFSEEERAGFGEFIRAQPCRTAAIFHDAIPLKFPHITWPRSVARHPGYMKLLAGFDRVWADSQASREELLGYWRWLGLVTVTSVKVLPLGADFNRSLRTTSHVEESGAVPILVCVGILEPRKNQELLLNVCEDLWREGLKFELHLVGRVNQHFGRPLAARVRALKQVRPQLHHHEAASDAALGALYSKARATVFPTIAEGCGLPLLESLWAGVPCVCSDLPVLRENADGGGCLAVGVNDANEWKIALRRVLTDDALVSRLRAEACSRLLPTWAGAAHVLREGLKQA